MKTKGTTMLLLWLFQAMCLLSQTRYSLVKIKIPAGGLGSLQKMRVALDHGELNAQDHTFITSLSDKELGILQKNGVPYEVMIADEAEEFKNTNRTENFYANSTRVTQSVSGVRSSLENSCTAFNTNINTPAAFTPGSMGGYYTYSEILAKIDEMINDYPGLVTKIVLSPNTLQGRQLVVVKISDNASTDESEPEAFYTGLHHAREPMSMMNLVFFMQFLLENYNSNSEIKSLVDNRELFFLPCVNPDGYAYNQSTNPSGGGGWRKNRRNNGGSFGVDLNRNYGIDWGANDVGSSPNPSDDDYRGSSAFSENETQAIRAFVETRHFTLTIDHHATGNYLIRSYGVDPSPQHPTLSTIDNYFFSYASQQMSRYNCFKAGDGLATVGYNANGNSRDWYIAGDIGGAGTKGKVYGYTAEIGNGGLGFWPSASNIIPISKDMVSQNLQMAYIAGSYFDVEDLDKLSITALSGNFNFQLRRIGLTDAPVTISIIPIENITGVGSPVTVNSLPNYFDATNESISYMLNPVIGSGNRIRYVYQVSSGGITWADTITKFYNPVSIVDDNIEGTLSANWTLGGNWGASSSWAVSGSRSLSESPSGDYTAGSNSFTTYKNSIDLSDAQAAFVSFRIRYEAQNCNDKLQIEITSDKTATTPVYQPICGRLSVAENKGTLSGEPSYTGYRIAWSKETIDLRNYLGNPNVGLRFNFTSNSSEQDDGFYIDDIEVVKSTALTLAVNFINVWCVIEQDGVMVKWDAVSDMDHDHFEVERAGDDNIFRVIGIVKGNPPYSLKDLSPANGPNNYRIKALDKFGKAMYSAIVSVNVKKQALLKVYPNPVKSEAKIQINYGSSENVSLQLVNPLGQIVYGKSISLKAGNNQVTLPMQQLQSQLYNLVIRDSKNEIIAVQRILKLP